MEIYLDNNATTPVDERVIESMLPYFREFFGNPSSLHKKGVEAQRALSEARQTIADSLGVKENEVYFTSGATESDNLALKGAAYANKNKGRHIVTTKVEHDAVLEAAKDLEKEGFEVTYLDVDEFGRISPREVAKEVRDDTILVAVMHVNNELGTIYPINEIASTVKEKNAATLFFSDGVQALGKLKISLEGVDLYAISGHKVHAPKGIGAIVVKKDTKLNPLVHGGHQEKNLRSGTENVPGAVGFAAAVKIAYEDIEKKQVHFKKLHDILMGIYSDISDVRINSPQDGVATTVNAAFKDIPAEVLLHALEEEEIYVSSGSACASNTGHSHVLDALDVPDWVRGSSVRFGLSRMNTEKDIEFTREKLKEIVPKLREVTQRK